MSGFRRFRQVFQLFDFFLVCLFADVRVDERHTVAIEDEVRVDVEPAQALRAFGNDLVLDELRNATVESGARERFVIELRVRLGRLRMRHEHLVLLRIFLKDLQEHAKHANS